MIVYLGGILTSVFKFFSETNKQTNKQNQQYLQGFPTLWKFKLQCKSSGKASYSEESLREAF